MVEMIIIFVIIAILAAIAIPVTLSIIDSSKENDVKLMAKNIMNAVQTEFNNLAGNDEIWISNGGQAGIILNKDRKNKGSTSYKDKTEFSNQFIKGLSNTVPVENIFKKIDNSENIFMLYVGAGKVYEYYDKDDKRKMYTAYVVIFQLKDSDEPIYIYTGKDVIKTWPFSTPDINSANQKGDNFVLSDRSDVKLQLYGMRIPNNADPNTYWNNTVVSTIKNQKE